MKMQLPDSVSYIIKKLEEQGFEAFAVGGCVRDAMLGREPEDWDITTSAHPEEIKRVFPKTIDTGIQHGTVTVMIDHVGYEVTTYRIDGEYEDGRHPKEVSFTTNLKMDLERRDFTINAMAYNDSIGLVDEFDGVGDLQRKIIRCVGDAGQRFDEDALRMLRAVRFSGQLGFEIEEKTRQAIIERAVHLEKISAERIRVELTKLLMSKEAGRLQAAYETGMTAVFLPELDDMMNCDQKNHHHIYTVGEHTIKGIEIMNDFFQEGKRQLFSGLSKTAKEWIGQVCEKLTKKQHCILVTAMLFHDIAKPVTMEIDKEGIGHFYGHPEKSAQMAKDIMKKLTYDNETIDTVKRLVTWHDYRIEPSLKAVRRAASKIGSDIMAMEFLVQYADILAQNPETFQEKLERIDKVVALYDEVERNHQPLSIKDLAVNGKDLIQAGIKPGPAMGEILEALLELVLEEPDKNKKEILLAEMNKL